MVDSLVSDESPEAQTFVRGCRETSTGMEHSDQQLIADYLKGDDAALEALIRRHLKGIYGYLRHIMGDAEEAEDVAQETFLKAWKRIRTYRPSASFKTWLFTIAHNAAIDHLRKRRDQRLSAFENEEGDNVLTETLADTEPLPDELVARLQDKASVEALLETLPLHYREVLLLRYHGDLTFEEMGKTLKRPLDTVKSQHRRALARLRDAIMHQNHGR